MSKPIRLKLSPGIAAAMAMGGVAVAAEEVQLDAAEKEAADKLAADQAAADKLAEDQAAAQAAAQAASDAAAAAAAPPATTASAPPVTASEDALVSHLKAEAADLRAQLSTLTEAGVRQRSEVERLTADLATANTTLAARDADIATLRGIATQVCEKMSIPLNASTVGMADMSNTQLAARFTELSADMQKHFSAGAKSSPTAQVNPSQSENSNPSLAIRAGVAITKLPR